MSKKIASLLIFIIIISFISVYVSAGTVDVFNKDTAETDMFIVTVTQPDRDYQTSVSTIFDLKGITDYDDVKVDLLKYNNEKDKYVPFENTDGESSWTINTSGYFWKQLDLDKSTINKFRLVTYRLSDKKKKQITDFSILVLNEKSFKNDSIDSIFNKILEPGKKLINSSEGSDEKVLEGKA